MRWEKNSSSLVGLQNKKIVDGRYYKGDNGVCYESISEVLVTELCLCIRNIPSFLDYYLDDNIFNEGCYSTLYTSEDVLDISVYELLNRDEMGSNILEQVYDLPDETYFNAIIMCLNDLTGLQTREYIEKILRLDYMTLNTDRHLGNIRFTINANTGKFDFAPIIDNGRALLSDVESYPIGGDIDFYYRRCMNSCKPFTENFARQQELLSCDLLELKYNKLKCRLETVLRNLKDYVPFKRLEFRRAVKVLFYCLEKSRNVAWREV